MERHSRSGRPSLWTLCVWIGLGAGMVGIALLALAAANSDYRACTPGEPTRVEINQGQTHASYDLCGGLDPLPLLLAAIAALVLAYALMRISRGR